MMNYGSGMMSGWGGGILSSANEVVWFVAGVLFVMWLWKQIAK